MDNDGYVFSFFFLIFSIPLFLGVTAALDDSVGSVVRALRKKGMLDNTIIVFTTDNGGPANNYDSNAACNSPLR